MSSATQASLCRREAFFSGKSVKIPFKTNDCRALDWWGYRVPKGGGGGERGGENLSNITEKWNRILTTLRGILLSFDLMKSEVEEREKMARSCCHNYVFFMSLLVVWNDINHDGNLKGKSRVTRCENRSRITLLCPITPLATIKLGPDHASRW